MSELQKKADEKSAVMNEKTLSGEVADTEQKDEKPVDYRYVPHGQGPCSCCGPYGE